MQWDPGVGPRAVPSCSCKQLVQLHAAVQRGTRAVADSYACLGVDRVILFGVKSSVMQNSFVCRGATSFSPLGNT